MGKRKTSSVKLKKVLRYPRTLDKAFSCPFCSQERAVDCRLDRARQQGQARCRSCGAGYQTTIHALTEAVDVYGEWIDAIDARQRARPRLPPPLSKPLVADDPTGNGKGPNFDEDGVRVSSRHASHANDDDDDHEDAEE
jgi:transcription elongation factor Elf1